jgi:hypothetical protein
MRARLGDIIDDYCVKCKRIMNHSVVSCLNDEPAKVRCRTCHGDHDYRHEQAPPTKADLRKAALFKEVLDRMGRGEGEAVDPLPADPSGTNSSASTPLPAAAPETNVLQSIGADGATTAEAVGMGPGKTKRAKVRK